MESSIVAAIITIATLGRAADVPLHPPAELRDTSPGGNERRESPEWRMARLEVFGNQQGAEPSRPELAPQDQAADVDPARCALLAARSDLSSSDACLECHGSAGSRLPGSSHPVNVDYRAAQARSAGALRPLEAVVARGVFLPEGVVQCTTCHDTRSPWADHIALPAGAVARAAVDPRKPETYVARANWRIAPAAHELPPPKGTAVSPAPLCAACHTLAD